METEVKRYPEELLGFLNACPSVYHAVENLSNRLANAGFRHLSEEERYDLAPGDKCFVTRNGSSLIAFAIPKTPDPAFRVVAAHGDSPMLKLKPQPELRENGFLRLNVEAYGGGLWYTWLDRPLTLAGRVLGLEGGKLCERLVAPDRDLLLIPSLAIHMDRSANENLQLNLQRHLLPVLGLLDAGVPVSGVRASSAGKMPGIGSLPLSEKLPAVEGGSAPDAAVSPFFRLLSEETGFAPEDILSYDLFLANRQKAVQWGADGEFISGPRIDNLECTFAAFHGFLEANGRDISVFCVFDNEEVGSATRQGAAATFLRDNLQRIAEELGMSREGYLRAVARGFMVSEDNAHSIHPGWPEKADPICRPLPNKGIVLKHHAGQRYATDAVSAAVFKRICRLHDIPWQEFANRSDMCGGSTLGNISSTRVPLRTVDIGLAQLAMHSAFETAGTKDTAWMEVFAKAFYEVESLGM